MVVVGHFSWLILITHLKIIKLMLLNYPLILLTVDLTWLLNNQDSMLLMSLKLDYFVNQITMPKNPDIFTLNQRTLIFSKLLLLEINNSLNLNLLKMKFHHYHYQKVKNGLNMLLIHHTKLLKVLDQLKEVPFILTYGRVKMVLGLLKEKLKMEENGNVEINLMSLMELIMKLYIKLGLEEFPQLKKNQKKDSLLNKMTLEFSINIF